MRTRLLVYTGARYENNILSASFQDYRTATHFAHAYEECKDIKIGGLVRAFRKGNKILSFEDLKAISPKPKAIPKWRGLHDLAIADAAADKMQDSIVKLTAPINGTSSHLLVYKGLRVHFNKKAYSFVNMATHKTVYLTEQPEHTDLDIGDMYKCSGELSTGNLHSFMYLGRSTDNNPMYKKMVDVWKEKDAAAAKVFYICQNASQDTLPESVEKALQTLEKAVSNMSNEVKKAIILRLMGSLS